MRDTLRLRRHLTLLACLPAVVACSGGASAEGKDGRVGKPAQHQSAQDGKQPRAESKVSHRGEERAAAKARKGPIINEAPDPDSGDERELTPQQLRLEPIEGDPPFIDGYNPEEAPCPSGNWCGTIETAMVLTVNPQFVKKELDCPTRISGSHDPSPIKGKKYAGLSDKRSMQGSLNQHGTELARAAGKDDACCYHWFEYCSGRPLMDEHGPQRATAHPADGWSDACASIDDGPEDARARAALAQAWVADALDEHASVASFARATLELMAVGAPADLLAQTQAASLDEIEHARLCFSLARRFGAEAQAPGPLPALAPRAADVATLARNVFLEGCVGETVAALVAERARSQTTDEPTATALSTIAADEARHAALAWRTVAWALQQDRGRVAAELRGLLGADLPSLGEQAPVDLRVWGRLSPAKRREAYRDAWRDIVTPMLEQLLA